MHSACLTEADLGPMLDTVQRFAARALADATAKPEVPLSHAVARELLNQLGSMGVLHAGAEPAGGVWDDPQDPLQRVFAVETLRCLAAYAPGVRNTWWQRYAKWLPQIMRHQLSGWRSAPGSSQDKKQEHTPCSQMSWPKSCLKQPLTLALPTGSIGRVVNMRGGDMARPRAAAPLR